MKGTNKEIEDTDAKCFICIDSDYEEIVKDIKERMKRFKDAQCESCCNQEGYVSLI